MPLGEGGGGGGAVLTGLEVNSSDDTLGMGTLGKGWHLVEVGEKGERINAGWAKGDGGTEGPCAGWAGAGGQCCGRAHRCGLAGLLGESPEPCGHTQGAAGGPQAGWRPLRTWCPHPPHRWTSCLVGQPFVWGPSARTTGQAAWSSKDLGLPPRETFRNLHLCKQSVLQHVDEVLEKEYWKMLGMFFHMIFKETGTLTSGSSKK